ncbi:hypothetical protein [Erythrobacter sp. R86502]|uniref:hypothetical protein n=1 Tax=Erythrobacter sp. R86502 TaxID=3093846 RepID=UPI0036D21467
MKVTYIHLAGALTLTFGIAACVPASTAPLTAPTPAPVLRPAPPRPAPVTQAPVYDNWMDARATAGAWRYQTEARGSTAVFIGGTAAEFALTCNRDTRSIALTRYGVTRAAPAMTIRSETATRSLPMNQSGAYPAQGASTLAPTDPLLDAMALSKGRFAVETEGLSPLYLPSHAEVSRVIEDCR